MVLFIVFLTSMMAPSAIFSHMRSFLCFSGKSLLAFRWCHTEFNVHSQVRTQTKRETERVGKYMIRPLLSLKRPHPLCLPKAGLT